MTKRSPTASGDPDRAPSQRLSPRAFLEVKRLNDPQIHPDGQRVAFTVSEADFEESRWVSHIWLTEWIPPEISIRNDGPDESPGKLSHGDGTAAEDDELPAPEELTRQLTFSTEGESDPLWSPDGRYLAFLSNRPDTTVPTEDDDEDDVPEPQIWALPMDGGEARRITDTKEAILDFAWAPDGVTVVYLTLEPRPRPLESVHKERERRKIDPVVEHDDTRRRQFWSVGVEDPKPSLLFTADYGVETFALSPVGDQIAYLTNYTGDENDYHIADLYVRDLESGSTAKLCRRDGGKYRLRWSPSGTYIAFLSWHDPQISYSRESIYIAAAPTRESLANAAHDLPSDSGPGGIVMPGTSTRPDVRLARAWIDAEGITECRQVSDLDRDIMSFEWSDDSTGILALVAVGTSTQLFQLNVEIPSSSTGRGPDDASCIRLGSDTGDRRELAVHRESGRSVWIQESGGSAPEITMRSEDGVEHVLTRLNAEFTEVYRLPRQETVHWSGADGQTIEGLLTYPLDYAFGNRYPMVVQVHGGPKGRAADNLMDYQMPSVWASEGYLVFRPNYRGSEGYGHAFAVANRRDLGGADYNDVISGVDWCIGQGLADIDQIGILGGSYGGYMVNWAISHTDRFKAAISMFGIFHLQTDYSSSRLSRWEHEYMGAYYWEDPDIYRKLSPGSFLASIRTPTLIIHGDEDENTSIGNSWELYRALVQRSIPVQFVHYPREGHGIQEPNHRLDELRRCLAWMDRYVRNGGIGQTVYRVGDRVSHLTGRLELCVTSTDLPSFLGQAEREDSVNQANFLEVVFTVHKVDPRLPVEPLTFALSDVRLTVTDTMQARQVPGQSRETGVISSAEPAAVPIGVPLDVPGGKVLVEGDNLRVAVKADPETGEFAFGVGVVFRVPRVGAGLLRVADFPPVWVHWSADQDHDSSASPAG